MSKNKQRQSTCNFEAEWKLADNGSTQYVTTLQTVQSLADSQMSSDLRQFLNGLSRDATVWVLRRKSLSGSEILAIQPDEVSARN